MLETYKSMSQHIENKYGLRREAETIRGWRSDKRMDGDALRCISASNRVHIAASDLDSWFERVILKRS